MHIVFTVIIIQVALFPIWQVYRTQIPTVTLNWISDKINELCMILVHKTINIFSVSSIAPEYVRFY